MVVDVMITHFYAAEGTLGPVHCTWSDHRWPAAKQVMNIPHSLFRFVLSVDLLLSVRRMLIATLLSLVVSGCICQPCGADTCARVVCWTSICRALAVLLLTPPCIKVTDSGPAAGWLTSSGPLYLCWSTGLSPGSSYTLWFGGRHINL